MSQKLPVNYIKWFDLIKYRFRFNAKNDGSDQRYFLEVDAHYFGNLHNLHNDLLFLHEKIKIEKVEKLLPSLHYKEEFVIQMIN